MLVSVVLIQMIFKGWSVCRPIPILAVVSANQATHLTEEGVMIIAPLHVDLIPNMGINKRKQDKGSGKKPAPPIRAQKNVKGRGEGA